MPRKYFRKYLPSAKSIREHRHLRRFRPILKHPNLWHLNRRSVAGGVAVGLWAGLIPGPIQMIMAGILAIVFRVNLPVAVATTWYTNPLTAVPLAVMSYGVGKLITGEHGRLPQLEFDWSNTDWAEFLPAFWHWLMSLGETFLIGTTVLGLVFAAVGYFAVRLAWRMHVLAYLRRRKRRNSGLRTED